MRIARPRAVTAAAFAAILLALAAPGAAQRVLCEMRPERAYVGQSVTYYVQIQLTEETKPECTLAEVEGLSLALQSEGVSNRSTQMFLVNGRREVRQALDYTFTFAVRGTRAGRYSMPAPTVIVNGEPYAGRATTLVLEDPADEDRALLEFRAEPPSLVLGQQGKLIVDVFLKHLPREANAPDPLSLYDQSRGFFDQGTAPPVLQLPWIAEPPQGLGPVDLNAWVQSRQVRRGFRLSGVRGGRFIETGAAEDTQRNDARGRAARYRRYRFSIEIRGETAGSYEFGPASLEGELVDQSGSRLRWREAFQRSASLRLDVLEPPRDGRPESFTGAVGTFSFSMEPPTPTLVGVGDPVYVTLVLAGQGFLKGVTLDLADQLGDAFRVERVGVTDALPVGAERPPGFPERPGQWRQWDFKVYPITDQVTELPPIACSWYDPNQRTYGTETTAAVPVTVRPATSGAANVVVASGAAAPRGDVELVPTSALSANVTDLNLLANQTPRPWPWLATLVALPILYTLLAWFVGRQRRLRDDPALLRRRRAASRAKERLRAARGAGGAGVQQAHAALCGYLADLTARDEEALTSADLLAWLDARDVAPELQARVRELCDAVEAMAFGGGAGDGDTRSLIEGLEPLLARGASQRPASLWWLAPLLVSLAAGAVRAQDAALLIAAQAAADAGDFATAATTYERALADGAGYENGYALYNLGNCYLRSGALGQAIAAYRRASLFLPGDANLEVNLRRALDARTTPLSAPDGRALLDYLLFWRPRLAFTEQAWLAVITGLAAFVLATARLLAGRRWPAVKVLTLVLGLAAALLAVSAALDYRELTAKDHGVVTEDSVVLRTGPGASFEPRYEQALGEGAELAVLASRDGWLKVLAGGQYEGWLPGNAAALW
ncbi:MAG: hypothetical protein AAF628_07300 [Planctomycetota bacterium]